jgi:glycosyltransferase involved in cell wall biosynthesis
VRALLAAWRLLGPGATLVLVGPRGWHESLPPERPGRRVLRLGFVDDRDLRALYAGARAFCYPSLKEGFGLPVLEAMAQGTPVVTSRGTATEEVAGDAGLLVDPRAPEEVADALQRLLADDDLHARLSSAARRRASLFTWEHSARLTLEAYRKVT